MKSLFQRLARPVMPRARQRCDLVFVMAISEGEWVGVEDLLDSLHTYLDCRWRLIAVDDATTDDTYEKLLDAGCWVVRNPEKLYLWGLDLTLRRGFREALRLFDSSFVVKIDPDALVIGPGLYRVLQDTFTAHPRVGIAGTYRIDWNGERRDLSYWRDRMKQRRKDLGKPLERALANGYILGEGVQGGCYALRSTCLERIDSAGWLEGAEGYRPRHIKGQQIGEDSLITMLVHAAGYEGLDIGGPGQPFGIWDVGLPMPPEDLIRQNRIVTHALKYHDDASLAARAYFLLRRQLDRDTTIKHQE
ncbi:MAG: glycosyltransferase family 2 protein [Thiobacillus sp.]|nr:glycosyltransferase family 2 protein [Thiobacillus sp.]